MTFYIPIHISTSLLSFGKTIKSLSSINPNYYFVKTLKQITCVKCGFFKIDWKLWWYNRISLCMFSIYKYQKFSYLLETQSIIVFVDKEKDVISNTRCMVNIINSLIAYSNLYNVALFGIFVHWCLLCFLLKLRLYA